MKIDRTKYTAHYENGVVKAMWVTVEVAIDSGMGESAHDAFDLSKKISDEWYNKNGGHFNQYPTLYPEPGVSPLPEIQVSKDDEQERVLALIKDIESETCLRLATGGGGLLSWGMVVNNMEKQYPKLREAYDKKYLELAKP